jgi:hypothetical protein
MDEADSIRLGLEVEEHRAENALAARSFVVSPWLNTLLRSSCVSVSPPQYSPSPPMPLSSHNTS